MSRSKLEDKLYGLLPLGGATQDMYRLIASVEGPPAERCSSVSESASAAPEDHEREINQERVRKSISFLEISLYLPPLGHDNAVLSSPMSKAFASMFPQRPAKHVTNNLDFLSHETAYSSSRASALNDCDQDPEHMWQRLLRVRAFPAAADEAETAAADCPATAGGRDLMVTRGATCELTETGQGGVSDNFGGSTGGTILSSPLKRPSKRLKLA